jgi:hypothetical protein
LSSFDCIEYIRNFRFSDMDNDANNAEISGSFAINVNSKTDN